MKASFRRFWGLLIKEFLQVFRDPSSIMVGIVVPVSLIFIFGYGLSLDVKNIPVAIVMEHITPQTQAMVSGLYGSPWFSPRRAVSMREAEAMMERKEVTAIVRLRNDFDRGKSLGSASAQIILHGTDSVTATLSGQYLTSVFALRLQSSLLQAGSHAQRGSANLSIRMWFNEAAESTWYLVPGVIVIVTTLVGTFLTALVMAREWERGTLESLFTTPAGRMEILLSKIVPYFFLSLLGLALCLLSARFLFYVPIRGSFGLILLSSSLYGIATLGIGLVISSVTRNQFLACQIAILLSFLPAMILSGFLFDLRCIPDIARIIGQFLPATYFMEILRTLFLAGDNGSVVFRNCLALLGYDIFFLAVALHFTPKKLD